MVSSGSDIFVCPVKNCFSTFRKISRLKTHSSVHSKEREYVCPNDECFKSFKRRDHLKRHEEQCHDNKTHLICSYENCGLAFCSSSSLKRHVSRKHLDPVYKCSHCHVVLSKKRELQIHEAKHKDEEPFRCDYKDCLKSFATPSRLKAHEKQHKGYECDSPLCGEIFYKWTAFCLHKRTEHPKVLLCTECEKPFYSKYNLKAHMQVHQATREAYHCPHEDCSRQYFQLKNLNAHIKSCHQDKFFACPIQGCLQKFVHKKSLPSHVESHQKPKQRKPRKKKQRSHFVKRRSAAAMLSGFEASKEDEQTILDEDRKKTAEDVKQQLLELRKNNIVDNSDNQTSVLLIEQNA